MNLFKFLYENARFNPDEIAIQSDYKAVTYKQLVNLINNNHQHLMTKNLTKRTIVYKINRQVDFLIDFLSLLTTNCWVIPVPPISNLHFDESEVLMHSDFIEDDSINNMEIEVDQNQCGIYHLTSGSTGIKKLCKRTLTSLVFEGISYKKLMSLNFNRIFSLAPIYHSFALGAAVFSSLTSNSTIRISDNFVPRKTVMTISNWDANVVIGVPVMIDAIAKVKVNENVQYDNLKIILSGTGNVSRRTVDLIKKRFGVSVSVNYGSTETGGLISRIDEEPHDSIGKEMDGVEVKIITEDGRIAKINEIGEAHVKCKYMMSEYVDNDNTFINGYFPMGDIMKKDSNGYYYIVGRIKNMINIGGKKVNPQIVQDAIFLYPNMEDCIVKKGIRKDGSEFVLAEVVSQDLNEIKLRKFLTKHLQQHEMPSMIKIVKKINRNYIGKHIEKND